ncbi:MAG: hypothetical protein ACLFR7_09880 [Opitutales bacterium]
MFPDFYAQRRPARGASRTPVLLAGFGLALVVSPLLRAQSGAITFEFHSMEEVDPATVAEVFPALSRLRVFPGLEFSGVLPDWYVLDRFQTQTVVLEEGAEDPNGDGVERTLVAEYRAVNRTNNLLTETGLLALNLEEGLDQIVSQSNVVGFIRPAPESSATRLPNPSDLPRAASQTAGYLDGFNGHLWWDFTSRTRTGYLEGSGAAYAPGHTAGDYLTIEVRDRTANLLGLDLPIGPSGEDRWDFFDTRVRSLEDGFAGRRNFLYAYVQRSDNFDAETLAAAGVPDNGLDPLSFQNEVYIVRFDDPYDTDADGLSDFFNLTETVTGMPPYADYGYGNDWYFSSLLESWVYSTRGQDWDYSLAFGWIFPAVDAGFDPESFWFYAPSSGDEENPLGWLWTNIDIFPFLYRAADESWILYQGTENTATGRRLHLLRWTGSAYLPETIDFQ